MTDITGVCVCVCVCLIWRKSLNLLNEFNKDWKIAAT